MDAYTVVVSQALEWAGTPMKIIFPSPPKSTSSSVPGACLVDEVLPARLVSSLKQFVLVGLGQHLFHGRWEREIGGGGRVKNLFLGSDASIWTCLPEANRPLAHVRIMAKFSGKTRSGKLPKETSSPT